MSLSPEQVFNDLVASVSSLQMASITSDGLANISYAPFAMDDEGDFYIFISQLASHTHDLINNPQIGALLIKDEQDTRQIFARTRVSYSCLVEQVSPSDSSYDEKLGLLESRFGNVLTVLRDLPDFILFRLVPQKGRFVKGFGQAFELGGEGLKELIHVGPDDIAR